MKSKATSAVITPASTHPRGERTAKVLIFLYATGTLISLFAWALAPLRGHRGFTWWETLFSLLNIPVTHTLVSVVMLGIISWALVRRKRAGLLAAMIFQAFGLLLGLSTLTALFTLDIPAELFTEPSLRNPLADIFSLAFGLSALWLLWRARASFPARIYRVGWVSAAATLLIGTLLSAFFVWFVASNHSVDPWHLTLHMFGIDTSAPTGAERRLGWLVQVASTIMGITLAIAALISLRSPRAVDNHTWTPEHELQVRSLLQDYGAQDSLSYFATRREKSVVFSPDGQAAVTYRVINSVCLASGDPVGAHGSWQAAIREWKEHARTYGWVLAAISVSEDGAAAYAQAGLSIIEMGDEAILHTDRFSLNNTSLTEVRQAVNRVRKGGYSVSIDYHQDLSEQQMSQLIAEADAWRHGATERGFSMALNRLGDPADARNILVTAQDAQGNPVGILSFVPWGKTGLSLDLMRRSPDAPNGVVEFMVAELMESAADFGISRVSLNFAMFRSTFANAQKFGASPFTRLASRTLGMFDRFLQLERLYNFNQKFAPEWSPRYLCSDSAVSLGQVAVAAGLAEGFLPQWMTRTDKTERSLTSEQVAQVREIERRRVAVADLEPRRSDQTRHRIRHLDQLRQAGHNPYPLGLRARYGVKELAEMLELGTASDREVTVAGRVRSVRLHGGVTFVTLIDGENTVQIVCERKALGTAEYGLLTANLDTGDIVAFTGVLGYSRTGTASLLAGSWQMASKALHPIPFDGFTDPEARARRRSTDLLVNADQVHNLKVRSATITSIRRTLDGDGFVEVETPILNTVHGGASARPFKTFINAYGADLTLRIAPELYLKRLVVGGMGAVYELGRDFRNEGADATHNPEFTVLEAYKPYADYTTMRLLTEVLIKNAAYAVFGDEVLPLGVKGSAVRVLTDVSGPWQVKTVLGALSEVVGFEVSLETDFEVLLRLAREHEIHVRDDMGPGAVIEELYGELVEARTVAPTFYTDFPVETSPLAGPHRSKPGLVERWDLVINGMEVGTAYSEMADALEQRKRLTEQSLKAAAGDLEAMQVDEDFLYALETGMPPTGGLGIGIDRLVMLLTQTQIRGVLAFPFVKPER